MSASQHTPTPWRPEKEDTDNGLNCDWLVQAICGKAWDNIAACGGCAYEDDWKYTDELRQANAEFIARACNSHEALEDIAIRIIAMANLSTNKELCKLGDDAESALKLAKG